MCPAEAEWLGFNIYSLEQRSSKNYESLQENVKNCTPCTILSSHPPVFIMSLNIY